MMSEGTEKTDAQNSEREEIFAKPVRAGKRTYFFDVKATRRNDYYLTITESKKRFNRDGRFFYEKHKLFLYKEDFDKFSEGLAEAIQFIRDSAPEMTELPEDKEEKTNQVEETVSENYSSDVDFEDLEDKS